MASELKPIIVYGTDGNEYELTAQAVTVGSETTYTLVNSTAAEIAIDKVYIDGGNTDTFSENAYFYGDGYEMLSQFYMRLNLINPKEHSTMSGHHYRMPQTEGFVTAYNYAYIEQEDKCFFIGAGTCNSYRTEILINPKEWRLYQILEGRTLRTGESLVLESIFSFNGADRNDCLARYGETLKSNYAIRKYAPMPDGWCSWYCYGPLVGEKDVYKNADCAGELNLEYILIDDGYQKHMGDWLTKSVRFKNNMKKVCGNIRKRGLKPAVWIAPFIASGKSDLFKKHSDWFIKDSGGKPLCADKCTYRGWRDAPWYFLDLTNKNALEYIKLVFFIMKYEWGVDYFKLDANVYGALPFGVRHGNMTAVEAYRYAMEAIWDAVGPNTFILGCNAPIMPSVGVVSGMRVSRDVSRKFTDIHAASRECFFRNWMHGAVWINDPDCVVQTNLKAAIGEKKDKAEENNGMFRYSAAFIRASGGTVLSGDKLFKLNDYDKRILKLLVSLKRVAAKFNFDYTLGVIDYGNVTEYLLFNEKEFDNRRFVINLDGGKLIDNFTGEKIENNGILEVEITGWSAGWYTLIRE